jgi:hypothetical protein
MTEQLALQQGLGNRRTIHRDERLVGASAIGMDRARDQLLSGPALARDQHGRVRRSDLDHPSQHFPNGLGSAHDVVEVITFLELLGEQLHLPVQAAGLYGLARPDQELLLAERLLNVVERPQLHRLDRAFDGAVRCHHDHLGQRLCLFDGT